ncbi:DNA polymerase III subunit gamma/tau [soil metagenome]
MAAIYREARPVTFAQVVGQEHVKDVLMAALARGRVGHAYLFSGPRGVGKTTTARLVAMAVNCEREEKPCGECESCRLVRSGSHPDVTELDAASNNSVEDIRDLREHVSLAAIRGGKRVWVLDEAHMLSKSAANALLKTLEEPPPGLVFVLATTEPEKLPPTILSRCQHFRFRRLSDAEIAGKLARLCEAAGVAAELAALHLVARAADGAMRDAESLLERLLATGEAVTLTDAEGALGLPPQERLQALARALAERDLSGLLGEAGRLYGDGFSPRSLVERLKLTLRGALHSKLGLDEGFTLELEEAALLRLIHTLDDEDERFVRRDDLFALEVALIKALNSLTLNSPTLNDQAPAGEAVRAASLPDFDPHRHGSPTAPARAAHQPAPAAPPQAAPGPTASSPTASSPGAPRTAPPRAAPKVGWRDIVGRASPQLKAFLIPAQDELGDGHIHLYYGDTHKFHYGQIKNRQDELEALVASVLGAGVKVLLHGPGEGRDRKK